MCRFWLSLSLIGFLLLTVGCGNADKGKNKGKDVPERVPVFPAAEPAKK